jgi:hypothetical protein
MDRTDDCFITEIALVDVSLLDWANSNHFAFSRLRRPMLSASPLFPHPNRDYSFFNSSANTTADAAFLASLIFDHLAPIYPFCLPKQITPLTASKELKPDEPFAPENTNVWFFLFCFVSF